MEYGNIAKVDIAAGIATREAVPSNIDGLPPDLLLDLTWTAIQEFIGIGWWPVEDNSPALGRYEMHGEETLTVDAARQVVISVSQIVPWPQELIDADVARVRREIKAGVQKRLDDFAKTREFDNILSATTYHASTIPEYAAMGNYAVLARDQTWLKVRQLEADPTFRPYGWPDVAPLMPELAWPQ